MNSACSSTYEYQPTIIETRFLLERLVIQLAFLRTELKLSWHEFKSNPPAFAKQKSREFVHRFGNCSSRHISFRRRLLQSVYLHA